MLQDASMPIATIIITVAVTVLVLALIYAAAQRLWPWQNNAAQRREAGGRVPTREASERLEYPSVPPHVAEIPDPVPDRSADWSAGNPKILGKLRSGREGNRPSEDDLVQLHVGRLGQPGERAANALPENITQIPKPLDPGHTA
jgi:hypothetical protein